MTLSVNRLIIERRSKGGERLISRPKIYDLLCQACLPSLFHIKFAKVYISQLFLLIILEKRPSLNVLHCVLGLFLTNKEGFIKAYDIELG
jgi:hypothetical protein